MFLNMEEGPHEKSKLSFFWDPFTFTEATAKANLLVDRAVGARQAKF
jgi:hypothetical protein